MSSFALPKTLPYYHNKKQNLTTINLKTNHLKTKLGQINGYPSRTQVFLTAIPNKKTASFGFWVGWVGCMNMFELKDFTGNEYVCVTVVAVVVAFARLVAFQWI